MLVAALHDTHEGCDGLSSGLPSEQMLFDGRFAPCFFRRVTHFISTAGKDVIDIFGSSVKFLCADYQIYVRQLVHQLTPAALGHAPHKPEQDVWAVPPPISHQVLHFAEGFLLGKIAHAARVKQDDIGYGFGGRKVVSLGDELSGDGFRIALVHLATVRLDKNTRH
jgi:hypothetical protein